VTYRELLISLLLLAQDNSLGGQGATMGKAVKLPGHQITTILPRHGMGLSHRITKELPDHQSINQCVRMARAFSRRSAIVVFSLQCAKKKRKRADN